MEERIYTLSNEIEERHWWFVGRRAVIDVLLDKAGAPRPARVLDAGCGTGRNLETYARLGEAEGVDPAEAAVRFCHARGFTGVRQGVATDLPFEDGRFGLVAATDVVEHIEDDAGALREMRRVTAPGGSLLITVPAYRWMWSDEDVRLQHFRRYTMGSMRSALEGAGWEPVWSSYFNTILLPPIALLRSLPFGGSDRAELQRTPTTLNRLLALPMRLEARLLRLGLRFPAGVSIGIVSRRS